MNRIIEANFLPEPVEEAKEKLNLARENGGYLQ